MLGSTYYAQNYASIIWTALATGDSLASNPGSPFRILSRSFGEKSEGEPGRISHVIQWHRDVAIYRTLRYTSHGMFVLLPTVRGKETQDHIQDSISTWRTGLLFIKRSYSSQLEIPVVTVLPKHRSLWASRKCLQLKLSSSWHPQTPVLPRNIFLWCYNQFHHV